jgi:gentisate 1,2-dioxygenase
VRYTNPASGGPVIPTLDASVIEIGVGNSTQPIRATASQLFVVIEGEGVSRVGDAAHHWSARDIFTVPEWAWLEHRAITGPARLLAISDHVFRRALGLYRDERG